MFSKKRSLLQKPTAGLEPAVLGLEVPRLIHWATRAELAVIGFDPMTSGLWALHASSAPHRYYLLLVACCLLLLLEIEGIDPTTSRMQSERSTV